MKICNIGPRTRITPSERKANVGEIKMGKGAQVLNIPHQGAVMGLNLEAGASADCKFAALRGGILMFHPDRTKPITVTGDDLTVLTGHILMDEATLTQITQANFGNKIPFTLIEGIAAEPLFLVRAEDCFPDELFLPRGLYPRAVYSENSVDHNHGKLVDGTLNLFESMLCNGNILEVLRLSAAPQRIDVQLSVREGGMVSLYRA
jgi:hypothetical protein